MNISAATCCFVKEAARTPAQGRQELTEQNYMQAVSKIEGLEACARLEQLWLTENEIQVIEGLEGCIQLRRLYLYSNQISAIQGLENLSQLEVLPSECQCTNSGTACICTATSFQQIQNLKPPTASGAAF